MQVSTWGIIGFYLWLLEAAVIMVTAASVGAQKKRPEICLVVGPLLVICPLVVLGIAGGEGTGLAMICALAATWLPLLCVAILPARQLAGSRAAPRFWDEPTGSTAYAHSGGPGARSAGDAAGKATGSQRQADDPYSILGLAPGASAREIKAAWRRCAAANHPDKVAHLGPELRQAADERMARINKAYETLRRSTADRLDG